MSIFEQSALNALGDTKKTKSAWRIKSIEVGPSIGSHLGFGNFWEINA